MRINVETFLALTVLLGTGVAVGVGVMKYRETGQDESAPVAAPATIESTPVAATPEPAAPAPAPVITPAPVVTAPGVTLEPPMPEVPDPELVPDDNADGIPGPMVES